MRAGAEVRPLALDLFACSGGSATGLEAAGFDVVGIDHKPSRHWTGSGELHEADLSTADAVEAVIRAFRPDFVSSSPPCQANSVATAKHARGRHANLIASTREGILRTGVPAWIENVPPIPAARWPEIVRPDVVLCGSMFPETQRLRRHRHFELLGWFVFTPPHVYCTFAPGTGERRLVESVHDGSECTNSRKVRAKRETVAVAVAVAVAGHGPPDAAQSKRYREKRDTVTVCANAAGGRGLHRGSGWRAKGKAEAERRKLVTVSGDNGSRGAGPRGEDDAPTWGQNRPGPECVRWREALGWPDGPRDRYSLAQAIPPAYAKWLGERFLETRAGKIRLPG